uniref:Uncharacterized protein n=1 Tax=Prevotella sp. GTC17262 TaxID=3236797 RepID=A0AB33JIX5_9BACT
MRARAKRNGYKNGTKYNNLLSQLVYSDILPTPLAVEIQHDKRVKALKEKGGKTIASRANGAHRPNGLMDFMNFYGILPTPNAAEATKWTTTYNPKSQMGTSLTAMATNGMLPTPLSKKTCHSWNWLMSPTASDGMRAMMTMDNLKGHRKKNAERSNLAEQVAHKIGGGTSRLSPLFVEEMMGFPLIYLVLPFLSLNGDKKL